ncbi:DUF5009 domain-containing protein [uncultured Draconibacterium sp.]|uniref:acyltransferase family protein n=1 Tax=uncultured Draconibacterium sp. TaxID=1573823 RepID=UPI0025F96356|nr:DUF5009 domain-containing protein [uncultured Draconibacterium sp.]
MTEQKTSRFVALDVFRGMTVAFMIIVNTPGNYTKVFAPFDHASWHGFTAADLVFPSFLFVVGAAISFVMKKWNTQPTGKVVWKIVKRSIIIFVLGYILMYPYSIMMKPAVHGIFPAFSQTRIMGVLQRIAVAYGIVSLMFYYLKPRTIAWASVAILILYWPVLVFWGSSPDPLTMQTNAVLKLDMWLLGAGHLWVGDGFPFDPEGILSTIPALVTVISGVFVGKYVQSNGRTYEGLAKLFMVGLVCFIIAYFWDFAFPINKKLWTSSFVLHTTGLNCMLLALIIYVLDFRGINFGVHFFQVFGRNPLFLYMLSMFAALLLMMIPFQGTNLQGWIYENIFAHAGEVFGSFLYAVVFMLLNWLVGYVLDRRKIYIKV